MGYYDAQMGSWLSDITGINIEGSEISLEDLAKGGIPGVSQQVVTDVLKSKDVQTTAKAAGLEATIRSITQSVSASPTKWAIGAVLAVVVGVYLSKKLF